MSNSSTSQKPEPTEAEAKPSYVKLAMRNMVQKRGTSLQHFALTTIGLLVVLVGLAYLTR
jgi:cell division septal protein FtsQ